MPKKLNRPILAFAGLAGSGKTTAARAVAAFAPKAVVRPFAHGLKRAAHALFGDFPKDDRGRHIYQTLGDYALGIDPDFAIDRMAEFVDANPGRHVIIDDVRTAAEAEWVLSHPDSRIVWVVPDHETRTLGEIRREATHPTERLDAVDVAKRTTVRGLILRVTHGKPAMTGEEVRRVMAYYAGVFK